MEYPRYPVPSDGDGPYCGQCAPELEPEALPPEMDYFLTCADCHRPLNCSLTTCGLQSFLESVVDVLCDWPDGWHGFCDEGYYKGMRCIEPLRDQVEDVRSSYGGLTHAEEHLLERFLDKTALLPPILPALAGTAIVIEDDGDPD